MAVTTPDVVIRYFKAADDKDLDALAECFTEDGRVLDEGHTYRGRAQIRSWREDLGTKWEYTVTVTGSEPVGDGQFRVATHVVGNFPGGEVDLNYRFGLRDGLITSLSIAE
jgi:ketosteroid isomerase-like protein